MRFHGVCGRLVTHPLHENLHPGDTLLRNPHRPLKDPLIFYFVMLGKLFGMSQAGAKDPSKNNLNTLSGFLTFRV
jgi:hypothetical protein